jgi:hypothetical protein
MATNNRALLQGYLDEALSDAEVAQVEKALRESEALRCLLRAIIQERDRGEHSLGAIWRRERLSCPAREQLGSYLLQALEPDLQEYVGFHLEIVGCPYCLANLADLQERHKEPARKAQERRRRFFESSAGLLHAGRSRKS